MTRSTATPAQLADELLAMLRIRWESHTLQPRVIGVAGESGSGKTHTASRLAEACNAAGVRTVVLHLDNYFILPPGTNHERRHDNLAHVGPQEVNMPLLAEHITAFRARARNVLAPLVDYPGNRFVEQSFDFSAAELLIVEGTYVLQLNQLDVRIFLAATHEDNAERRRLRARDLDAPFIAQVLAIEHAIIAKQAAIADILIDDQFQIVRTV